MVEPSLFIVVVNWNSWRYTLTCLESILRSDLPHLTVVVCDNGSTDHSWDAMRHWAEGELDSPLPGSRGLEILTTGPRPSTVRCAFLSDVSSRKLSADHANIYFVKRIVNDGFASGTNAGIQLSLQLGGEYIWIVNNDTLVDPAAARHILEYMRTYPEVGLCGCTIKDYDSPERILALSGRHYHRATGRSTPLLSSIALQRRLSYIEGASICVSRRYLLAVGALCEQYFLYCEDLDWAVRRDATFSLGYCANAVIYHKSGGSFDSHAAGFRDYCSLRSCLLITKKFWPWWLLTLIPAVIVSSLIAGLKGRRRKPLIALCAVAAELRCRVRWLERWLGFDSSQLERLYECRNRRSPAALILHQQPDVSSVHVMQR